VAQDGSDGEAVTCEQVEPYLVPGKQLTNKTDTVYFDLYDIKYTPDYQHTHYLIHVLLVDILSFSYCTLLVEFNELTNPTEQNFS
jgi:hypothetical protein